jgi:Gas vesicle synthesis protein GvpL/GvpF
VIELYAIAGRAGPPLPELASVRELPCNGLMALCGPAGEEEAVTEEALWRHEEIVEALMENRDLLPVRYGTRLADEQAVAREVAARSEELRAALERVRGAVELSLRVRVREAGAMPNVHETLRPLARDAVARPVHDEHEVLRNAYLVDRDAVGCFRDEVARLQEANPELALLLTGPWPAYSFAER